MIKVVALLTEYETGDSVVAIRDVYIQNPEIKIRVSEASDAPTHGSSVLALCHVPNTPPPLLTDFRGANAGAEAGGRDQTGEPTGRATEQLHIRGGRRRPH